MAYGDEDKEHEEFRKKVYAESAPVAEKKPAEAPAKPAEKK